MIGAGDQYNYLNATENILRTSEQHSQTLDYSTIVIFHWIVYTVVCQVIDVSGVGTNIVNIICFTKQGFKDPINITLLGLAISDLGCLTTLIWLNISFTPAFMEAELPFDAMEFQYLSGGMLHASFTRVSGWISALITLERCLCIMYPLKVKNIVTPKRVFIIVVCVFFLFIGSGTPTYVVNRLDWKFFPHRNKTLIGLVHTEGGDSVEKISYAINNAFIPFSSYVIIVTCTITLVIKLQNVSKWRSKSTTNVQADNVSARNQKVAKMVVMISTIFIACFIPINFTFIAMLLLPGMSFDGENRNVLIMFGGLGIVLESINSSVNIFFYYHMSSKYRQTFRQLFNLQHDNK